jgi:hypothetical protein
MIEHGDGWIVINSAKMYLHMQFLDNRSNCHKYFSLRIQEWRIQYIYVGLNMYAAKHLFMFDQRFNRQGKGCGLAPSLGANIRPLHITTTMGNIADRGLVLGSWAVAYDRGLSTFLGMGKC